MPRSRASRMSSPGVVYPVHETTPNRPTSAASSPASASAADTASLPSGISSARNRCIRAPVPVSHNDSTVGSITPCRVSIPDAANTRAATRWNGSSGTPGAGHCSPRPATCAQTGWDWPPSAATRRTTRRCSDGDRRLRVTASITGMAHAVPAAASQQRLWDDYFREHYAGNRVAARVFAASGIETRHGVIDPTVESLCDTGTGARMQRFLAEAIPLGKEAVSAALADAGLDAADVGLFGVVSCTGYTTPGLDILLARDLGMTPEVQRLHIGHMGCYAALPGLGAVSDFVTARGRLAVMLCLELTTLHVQPPTESARSGPPTAEDLQQMV